MQQMTNDVVWHWSEVGLGKPPHNPCSLSHCGLRKKREMSTMRRLFGSRQLDGRQAVINRLLAEYYNKITIHYLPNNNILLFAIHSLMPNDRPNRLTGLTEH